MAGAAPPAAGKLPRQGSCRSENPHRTWGKPYLEEGAGLPGLRFNLSHGASQALFAFSPGAELGVDLEEVRPRQDALDLARHFFTPQEQGWLKGMAAIERDRAFARLWTLKEAYLKALGLGLSKPLNSFEVSPGCFGLQGPVLADFQPQAPGWGLFELDLGLEVCGSLAFRGSPARNQVRAWWMHRAGGRASFFQPQLEAADGTCQLV